MKKNGYKYACYWIAVNDDSHLDLENIEGYISTMLVADIFNKEPLEVATVVLKYRIEYFKSEPLLKVLLPY